MSVRLGIAALACLLACLGTPGLAAGDEAQPRPMVPGSLATILAARAGKPFLVAYWSVSCAHCPKELRALGELKRRHPGLDIVLVSTDTPEDGAEAARLAAGYGLATAEQWVFAVDAPERLRAEIDRRWHGELPRTVFYDRDHRARGVSGVLPPQRLQAWAEANAP